MTAAGQADYRVGIKALRTIAEEHGISHTAITKRAKRDGWLRCVSGRPILSDLKESGSIEEDADVVILLSRNGEEKNGFRVINCDVPKNRQGKTGALSLGFDGRFQEWRPVATPLAYRPGGRRQFTDDV